MPSEWSRALPTTYKPNWKEMWAKGRPRKEVGFLWSLYHDVVVVNAWRHRINPNISFNYSSYNTNLVETKLHRFYAYPKAQAAWRYALIILHSSPGIAPFKGSWPQFTWQQCILGSRIPARLKARKHFWSLFRSSILWLI